MQPGDEPYIQKDVQHGGAQKDHQGKHGFSKTAQNACHDVVKAVAGQSSKTDEQISAGHIIAFRRRLGNRKDAIQSKEANSRKNNGNDGDHRDAVAYAAFQFVILSGSEILGYHDRDAGTDGNEENEKQIQGGRGNADGAQGPVTDEPSYYDAVYRAVQQLGQIAD